MGAAEWTSLNAVVVVGNGVGVGVGVSVGKGVACCDDCGRKRQIVASRLEGELPESAMASSDVETDAGYGASVLAAAGVRVAR